MDAVALALSAISAADGAKEIADGGDDDGTDTGEAARNFSPAQGFGRAWQEWENFCKRVERGDSHASCVVDFCYSDGQRLKGKDRQLERAYCFHDPATASADELLVVIHVHTTQRWDDRRKQAAGGKLEKITSVNVRHAFKPRHARDFKQEASNQSLRVVPGNKKLANGWRGMPEREIEWAMKGDGRPSSVPPLDRDFTRRYEGVARVISKGEELCRDATLAHSLAETQTMMRGGEEVEYEVVACMPDRGKVRWGGLRVAGLCIGVDDYAHIPPLGNAVRDAEAFNKKLKAMPGCFSAVIRNPADARDLLRSIRKHLQDADMLENPPEVIVIYYAGHGIQQGHKVYLVPVNATLEELDDLDVECVSLDKLMQMLRRDFDEPVQRKMGEVKAPVFLLALDSCRDALPTRAAVQEALSCEPNKDAAPLKYTILFSCSRSTTASDGSRGGHSPFATALLDPQRGLFAEGVSVSAAVAHMSSSLQARGQTAISLRLECIPSQLCLLPVPHQPPSSVEPRATAAASGAGASTAFSPDDKAATTHAAVDEDLLDKLREFGIEDAAGALAKHGFKKLRTLKRMEDRYGHATLLCIFQPQGMCVCTRMRHDDYIVYKVNPQHRAKARSTP